MARLLRVAQPRKFHEFAPGNGSFEIEDLQAQLNMLGYGLAVNGRWDGPTQNAVIFFKQAVGLPPTPLADSDFADALFAALEELDPVTGKPKIPTVRMDPLLITGKRSGWGWLALLAAAGAYILS